MSRNPFHYALSLTLFGSIFLVLGLLGCELQKNPWSFVACDWSESVRANEVWLGAAMLAASGFFWRRAIRSLREAR
jgi:hypothetical protein